MPESARTIAQHVERMQLHRAAADRERERFANMLLSSMSDDMHDNHDNHDDHNHTRRHFRPLRSAARRSVRRGRSVPRAERGRASGVGEGATQGAQEDQAATRQRERPAGSRRHRARPEIGQARRDRTRRVVRARRSSCSTCSTPAVVAGAATDQQREPLLATQPREIAVYYAVPQGTTADPGAAVAIEHDLGEVQNWLASQTGGKVLRFKEVDGAIDVQTRELNTTADELKASANADGLVHDAFLDNGQEPNEIVLAFVPVDRGTDCGGGASSDFFFPPKPNRRNSLGGSGSTWWEALRLPSDSSYSEACGGSSKEAVEPGTVWPAAVSAPADSAGHCSSGVSTGEALPAKNGSEANGSATIGSGFGVPADRSSSVG